jgi:hypothetical protein
LTKEKTSTRVKDIDTQEIREDELWITQSHV